MEMNDISSFWIFFSCQFLVSNSRTKDCFVIPRSANCLAACLTWLAALLPHFLFVWCLDPDIIFRATDLLLRQAVTCRSIDLYQRI